MSRIYEIIGELKVQEICDLYRLSYKERGELRDVLTRFDAVERFLEEENDQHICKAQADVVADALRDSPRGHAIRYAVVSICDELRRIRCVVSQLNDLKNAGAWLH